MINFKTIEKSKRKINMSNNVKYLNYNTKVKKFENKLAKTKSNNKYKNKKEENDINNNFFLKFLKIIIFQFVHQTKMKKQIKMKK